MTIPYGVDYTCEHGEPPDDCLKCADAAYLGEFTAEQDTKADAEQDPAGDVDEFWTARPALEHIRTFARARRASPWAVLGVVLTRVIAVTPRFVMLPPMVGGRASLNLFAALVGPSGAGKGIAEQVAVDAIDVGPVNVAGVGSGEGIAHLFLRRVKQDIEQHSESVLLSVPEIDTLAALADRRGATLLPELRKAWRGEALGFTYADPVKRLPLQAHAYRLCLIAGVQPARAGSLLDDQDGGTPQRFIWLPATDPLAPDVAPPEPEPMKWRLPVWHGEYGTGQVQLPVCDTARRIIDTHRLAVLRGQAAALDGHALLARVKLAAALAILDRRAEVVDADWDLAGTLMQVSDATRAHIIDGLRRTDAERNRRRGEAEADRAIVVEERKEDAAAKRVARAIARRLNGVWTPHAELRRRVAHRDRAYVDDALERLLAAGQIEAEPTDQDHAEIGRRYRSAGAAQ